MKFNTLLIIYFILISTHLSFSQAPAIEWQNTIGGSSDDNLYSIQQTSDGGYILGGYSSSGISGDKTEASLGGVDYWVVKLNSSGAIEWQNTIGGSSDDWLRSLQQTTDGGYILGGYSSSGISGDKTEALLGGFDYWVVKLNSSGAIEWQNTIGGSSDDYLTTLRQTTEGGYIVGGYSYSGISVDKTEEKLGVSDYWVLKLNSSGAIEWQNTIGGSNSDFLKSLRQTTDGGYIVGGYSYSGISGDKAEISMGSSDYWVLKLNSSGAIEWQNAIGGNYGDELTSLQQTTEGGYIVGGNSTSGISGDKTEATLGNWDYWVVKLNSSGVIEWQNTIGGSGGDGLYSLQQTVDGGYILGGGSASGISGDKTETLVGSSDYWIVKLNSSGVIESQIGIGGDGHDDLYSLQQTTDGGYILGGWSNSGISGDKTESSLGSYDYWLLKLEGPGCTPSLEICNALDDNCNGLIDDDITETISISAGGATTFCQGGNVVLTATYSGTSIQWKKNGVDIIGATSDTYTATKTGDYTCETTSICGTAISTLIHVTVNKNPSASITAGGATTFCAGGSVTLTEAPVGGSSYQWYKGAAAIAGATSTNYIATTAGNYKCRVTKTATGCFKNSNTIAVSVPCRDENNTTENIFTVYPNPAKNFIIIETNLSSEKTIYITNALGQILQTINTSENTITIDINNISSGVYYIRMEDGVNSQTKMFIKK